MKNSAVAGSPGTPGTPNDAAPASLGEFDVIKKYFDRSPARHALLGIGDDAALLDATDQCTAIATDMLVQGRHFFAHTDPASTGYKSLAVNLSDLAAMGATPRVFTLALAMPDADPAWLAAFSAGLFDAADSMGCELVGGDTTRGPLTISITVVGSVPTGAAIRRDQSEPGDDVWVSGFLGAAAAVVALRAGDQRLAALPALAHQRLDRPMPRLDLGIELRHIASAAIDVSDGLLADLAHITERSRVAIDVCADDVPVDPLIRTVTSDDRAIGFALNGGDDYELAFTSAPENRVAIKALAQRLSLPLSRIGVVRAGQGVQVFDAAGHPSPVVAAGFEHFAREQHGAE